MNQRLIRALGLAFCCIAAAACGRYNQNFAPAAPASAAQMPAVTSLDEASARSARVLSYHIMPLRSQQAGGRVGGDTRLKYPADLVRKKGPVMKSAAAFNIYVNCKSGGESCWGDPEGFQKNLSGSTFAALLTQYTHTPPSSYTFGRSFSVTYHTYTKLFYSNDLLTVLHAALDKNGMSAGYSTLYHIFLPKGTDTCFDRTRFCYSPGHPKDEQLLCLPRERRVQECTRTGYRFGRAVSGCGLLRVAPLLRRKRAHQLHRVNARPRNLRIDHRSGPRFRVV